MSTPLVTATEAGYASATFAALAPGAQALLIAAATDAINRECDRYLGSASYSETHDAGRTRVILLKQFPVTAVARVATDLYPVLSVRNTATSVQRATVGFTTGGTEEAPTFLGLTLDSLASGVTTTTPLLAADHPTLGALAAAIAAIPGWTAAVLDPAAGSSATTVDYSLFATADLNPEIGTQDAFSAPLDLYAYARDLSFKLLPKGEWTRKVQLFEARPDTFRFPDQTYGSGYWGFGPSGYDPDFGTVRVSYTAGWATANVPGDLKEAAILAVQFLRERQAATGVFASKTVGKASYSVGTAPQRHALPDYIVAMLARHRRSDLA